MEPQTPSLSPKHSSVDTSRPFRSVKEAVAVFGERLLTGELYAPKPYVGTTVSPDNDNYQETPRRSANSSSPSIKTPKEGSATDEEDPKVEVLDTMRKLEAELEETKMELKQLKERESETEIALATLNAELHKNKSKLAEAEAAAAAAKKVAVVARTASYNELGKGEDIAREEAKRRELMKRMEDNNQTLAEILSISGEKEAYFGSSKRETKKVGMKKKPIIPLVGDFFFFRKKNADHLHSIYGRSPAVNYFN